MIHVLDRLAQAWIAGPIALKLVLILAMLLVLLLVGSAPAMAEPEINPFRWRF